MKEEVVITNTDGSISIIGGESEAALFLDGVPIQFTWLRELGTTMRYQIAKNVYESDVVQDRQFTDFVKHGQLSEGSLTSQFQYILGKLNKGRYQLELTYIAPNQIDLVEVADKDGYYQTESNGSTAAVIQTQAYTKKAAIEKYTELIRKGIEPIIILLKTKGAEDAFILDGHHKYLAYARENKPARVLIITRLDSEPIDETIGQELFRISGVENADYQKSFWEGIKG